jgi:SAM-dependent methyltransferase
VSGIAKTFDAFARRYDAWFRGKEGRVIFPAEVDAVRMLLRRLHPPFLEVGVGTGAFAQALGVTVGVDPAIGALKIAAARGVAGIQGVGEGLPFKDSSFGGVLLISTLCFVDRPLPVLREAARVTRTDGGVLVAGIVRDSAWGRYYLEKKAEGHTFYRHATFYTLDDLLNMFRAAGLTVVASSSTLLQPPAARIKPEAAVGSLAPGASFVSLLAVREE